MQQHRSTTTATRVQDPSLAVDQTDALTAGAVSGARDAVPRREERVARRRLRATRHARAARAKADARRRAAMIREELARSRAKDCRCPITPDSTIEDLRALGAGCTTGQWVCPTLDAIRRRLGR
ncbi:MAG: hypothetical protein ACRDMJ_05575 [Solirubrobacteraceae bacterium]